MGARQPEQAQDGKRNAAHPRVLVQPIERQAIRQRTRIAAALPPQEEPEVWCKRCGLDPAVGVRGSGCDRCRYLPDTEARKLYDERPTA